MSAGRRAAECVSSGDCGSSKPGRSFSGWKPALSSQAKSTSRTALWRRVRSPPATQVAAWWLWRSSTPSQSGHQQSWTASGTPSRKRSSAEKTAGSSRVRPDGTAARKARPPRPASEWSTAFSTRLACVSCTCQTCVVQPLREVVLLGRQGRIKGQAFVCRKVSAHSLQCSHHRRRRPNSSGPRRRSRGRHKQQGSPPAMPSRQPAHG